jgi:hypothetical protein
MMWIHHEERLTSTTFEVRGAATVVVGVASPLVDTYLHRRHPKNVSTLLHGRKLGVSDR